jgi:DeoR/GlpR family transcriptional regulator of sugar metabolism
VEFSVSEVTIRNDLTSWKRRTCLSGHGRRHGFKQRGFPDQRISEKNKLNLKEKIKIGVKIAWSARATPSSSIQAPPREVAKNPKAYAT